MYRKLNVSVVIPAYNEELLIKQTIDKLPDFVDYIIVVDDGSKDDTFSVVKKLKKENDKIIPLQNKVNQGIGATLINGYKYALDKTNSDVIGIVAADDQFDTKYLGPMLDDMIKHDCDYVKASRFFHREELKKMPRYRQIGNVFISLLTKFSTGYYSITDITNGCGFLKRDILLKVNFSMVRSRYDYETSMLTALSIAGAKIRDHAVPAYYGEEKSTINLLPTAMHNLSAVWSGFWQRIYYKYVLFSFHPIALSLFGGIFLGTIGVLYGIFLIFEKLVNKVTPSTSSVMLVTLTLVLGFQLMLSALIMDVNNEDKS